MLYIGWLNIDPYNLPLLILRICLYFVRINVFVIYFNGFGFKMWFDIPLEDNGTDFISPYDSIGTELSSAAMKQMIISIAFPACFAAEVVIFVSKIWFFHFCQFRLLQFGDKGSFFSLFFFFFPVSNCSLSLKKLVQSQKILKNLALLPQLDYTLVAPSTWSFRESPEPLFVGRRFVWQLHLLLAMGFCYWFDHMLFLPGSILLLILDLILVKLSCFQDLAVNGLTLLCNCLLK